MAKRAPELEKLKKELAHYKREAQIEASLEKVRAASMAMHQSSELPDVALTMMNQIEVLGISQVSCSINIADPEIKKFYSYSATILDGHDRKAVDLFPELNLKDLQSFLRFAAFWLLRSK